MESATAEQQKKEASEVLDLKNMIAGELVDPAEGKTEDVMNPATGEVIAEVPDGSIDDVERAMAAAREARIPWRDTTPAQRMDALLGLADLVERVGNGVAPVAVGPVLTPRVTAEAPDGAMPA